MILERYFNQFSAGDQFSVMTHELLKFKKFISSNLPNTQRPSIKFQEDFSSGTPLAQNIFIARLKFYNELFESGVRPEIDFQESTFLWALFKKIGLFPPSDLMDQIDMSTYLEIRDKNGLQIFGNFNFLSILSYSVEDLFWYPWDNLFSRDQQIVEMIQKEFIQTVTTARHPFKPNVPKHICEELHSERKHKAFVEMTMFSPLFNHSGDREYMIATSKITRFD
jgi:hypothetical protein